MVLELLFFKTIFLQPNVYTILYVSESRSVFFSETKGKKDD